jgi:hypothetical protein
MYIFAPFELLVAAAISAFEKLWRVSAIDLKFA